MPRSDRNPAAARPARPLLIVNPNSNPAVSELIRAAAARALPHDAPALVVNPSGGPISIETPRHKADAAPLVLALVREAGPENHGAVVMACFDDLALDDLRRAVSIPVVGAFEAGLLAVRSHTRRFAIVTTFEGALPGIRELLRRHGGDDLCRLRAAGVGVAEAARSGDAGDRRIGAAVRAAVEEDGAEAVLLGSGGLTGRAGELQARFGVPVIDGVEAAIRIAGALAEAAAARLA